MYKRKNTGQTRIIQKNLNRKNKILTNYKIIYPEF